MKWALLDRVTICCGARRSPRGRLRCEAPALHGCFAEGVAPVHVAHDRAGRLHFWRMEVKK